MDALALLCDYAQVVGGKLYIMGAGWDEVVLNSPLTMGVAVRIEVPWDRTNTPLLVEIRLVDQDGMIVQMEGEPVTLINRVEVGRPPGTKHGTPIALPLAITLQGLQLAKGRYIVDVLVEDESVAKAAFTVRVPLQS